MPRLLLSPILLLLLLGGVEAYDGRRRHGHLRATADNYTCYHAPATVGVGGCRIGRRQLQLCGQGDVTSPTLRISHSHVNEQDRRPDKTRLRVVQYNVEFFFLDHWTGGVPCPSACVLACCDSAARCDAGFWLPDPDRSTPSHA